jgi:hypothetical protein
MDTTEVGKCSQHEETKIRLLKKMANEQRKQENVTFNRTTG